MGGRSVPSPPVLASFVLRLLPSSLRDGTVAGEVQVVSTGERVAVRNGEELLQVLRDRGASEDGGDRPAMQEEL
jgi:hypothetical protein